MFDFLSLQKDFLESFRGGASFESYIKVKGPSPENRFAVYHTNITESLRKGLAIIYPLTWELIGENCANGAAYTFIREGTSFPTTGNLNDWGETFPDFLERFPPTQTLAYLPDFARMEWLKHLSYGAPDVSSLNGYDFKDMDSEGYAKLLLKLHPSAHLFSSSYPLDQVLAVVKGDVESIELENRKSNALIIRPAQFVYIHWLSDSDFAFFSYLHRGDSLMDAIEKSDEKVFQFHETLSFSLRNGLFSEYAFLS